MTNKKLTGFFDLDAIKYQLAFAGQKSSIKAVHNQSGDEYEFKTRSEFWGRTKDIGGWLAVDNLLRESPRQREEFIIEDIVKADPVENVLYSTRHKIESVVRESGVRDWYGFIGEGDSFRVELSTLQKYKGQRTSPSPHHLEAVSNYIKSKYSDRVEVTKGYESDDRIVMECHNNPKHLALIAEKDYYGCGLLLYNFEKPEEGIVNCYGFGKLWMDSSGKTKKYRGTGRLFKYYQISSSDTIDHYASNCFSDVRWGQQHAFDSLVNCKDDKEAFTEMVKIFKYLYPIPKTITGWRGNDIEIDWLYVMQEMTDMAHLHRKENDWLNVRDILNNLGVEY